MMLSELETTLKEKVDTYIGRKRDVYPRWTNWAGDLGFDCDSYQALCRLHPELKPLPDLGLLKVFRASAMTEGPNLKLLEEAGVHVVEQARPYQWIEKKISGKIDSKVEVELDGRRVRMPLEHKGLSPNMMRVVAQHKRDGVPLWEAKYPWLRKYPGQLQIYELMDNSEHGLWMFYDKVCGDFFFWYLPLDMAYAETLVQRAERCNANVDAATVPPPERKPICAGCDFEYTSCFVGRESGPGYEFVTDAEWQEKIRRYLELKPLADEADELYDEVKEGFRGRTAIIGTEYKVESKPQLTTYYDVPKDVKAPYAVKKEIFRTTISRLGK